MDKTTDLICGILWLILSLSFYAFSFDESPCNELSSYAIANRYFACGYLIISTLHFGDYCKSKIRESKPDKVNKYDNIIKACGLFLASLFFIVCDVKLLASIPLMGAIIYGVFYVTNIEKTENTDKLILVLLFNMASTLYIIVILINNVIDKESLYVGGSCLILSNILIISLIVDKIKKQYLDKDRNVEAEV